MKGHMTRNHLSDERLPVLRSLGGFLSWAALAFAVSLTAAIYFCRSMAGGMEMPGDWTMSMVWMPMPDQTWLAAAAMVLLMWMAMMVAMMLPPAIPMLLHFRRSWAENDNAGVFTMLVACGYFTLWLGLGIVVYAAGLLWASAAMRWTVLSQATPLLGGGTLLLAGVIQFIRWKMDGLARCRDPYVCSAIGEGPRAWGAWGHGFRQGISCGICCSGPMLAMLVLGVMNLYVMFGLAGVIALEKSLARPRPVVHLTGILALAGGMGMIAKALL